MKVVISQPMFFPWVGLFEQIRLADVYVHYEDVKFSKGGFVNRVQIKTEQGIRWMTVPLEKHQSGSNIEDTLISKKVAWKNQHVGLFKRAYQNAPFVDAALQIMAEVYEPDYESIGALSAACVETVSQHLKINTSVEFLQSRDVSSSGSGSQRVLDIVKALGGTTYITGHGARNYLEHELFDRHGIDVQYMDYKKVPYPQLHGAFTPFVSILDLIANADQHAAEYLQSTSVYWKNYV